jgi:hypothetical protein
MASKDTLTVAYSTADASSVAAFVSERYDLGGTPVCALPNVIYVTDSERFVLRCSGRRGRAGRGDYTDAGGSAVRIRHATSRSARSRAVSLCERTAAARGRVPARVGA